jgi:ORF6N domain
LTLCSTWARRPKEHVSLELIPVPTIQRRILLVRERQVMLDEDLAELYGVETKPLIEQVKRNMGRFPPAFMFQLTREEAALKSRPLTRRLRNGSPNQTRHQGRAW